VHSTDSIKAAIEIFVKGVHRVAVTDDKNQIIHVLSQSDIIRWMAGDFTRMGSKANVEVDKLDIKKLGSLVAAPSTTRTVEVFELMKEKGVTSVAILGKDGTLEGVLSASDLKVTWLYICCHGN
jgi:CBS domain-containing protein